ncbi:long-subunit fatty acid transport protein [Mucilaginibacter sp. UYNi724]
MYKKLLLICVSAIAIQTAKAQTQKGSQMLGASFGFSTSSSDSKQFEPNNNTYGDNQHAKTTSYNFAPSYSYFIADNLDLGISVGYGHSKQESENDPSSFGVQKSHGFSAGVYARKYVLYENKIGIRTGPYLNYYYGKQDAFNDDYPAYNNYSSKMYAGGISLDFVYFPVKKLGLAAGLGNLSYVHQTNDGSIKGTYNAFNLSFANALSLSVNYVF